LTTFGEALETTFVRLFGVAVITGQQSGLTDDSGRGTTLENAWNHAIEAKGMAGLDLILADTLVAVDTDGSVASKAAYLAGIKDAEYQPAQAVNEQMKVQKYGDTAVAVGVFRIEGTDKKAFVHRQRTVDIWVKQNGTWKCVSAVAVEITGKPSSNGVVGKRVDTQGEFTALRLERARVHVPPIAGANRRQDAGATANYRKRDPRCQSGCAEKIVARSSFCCWQARPQT
jgi:ketosteroid isomerase-like protein